MKRRWPLKDYRFAITHPNAFFMANILEQPDGCWKWLGNMNLGLGYGMVQHPQRRRNVPAHRWAYELFVGPIPDGLHVDHLCRNRRCVNPLHLEAVTQRENTLRGMGIAAINARKTHCPKGHEYTPENTYLQGPLKRNRVCKTCVRERQRESARRRLAS